MLPADPGLEMEQVNRFRPVTRWPTERRDAEPGCIRLRAPLLATRIIRPVAPAYKSTLVPG